MHQALYRKYRPFDFDSVVGQDVIVKTLKNSIITNKINHAYMFYGPRGVGKTTLSKIFARSVNCLNPIDGLSCGKCDNCLKSYEKNCIDILELDAASNNGVDEIREIISKVSLVPTYLKYKVYIIDEVHMLSIGAFNALLKTLEEPPEHVIFILATTDSHKVPETISSRCQCFSFNRISNDVIVDRLKYISKKEKIKIDDDVLDQIAIASNGGMRDSIVMIEQLSSYTNGKIDINVFSELNGTVNYNDLEMFCDFIINNRYNEVINFINELNHNGKNIVLIINQLINFMRNVVVNKTLSDDYTFLDLYIDLINLLNDKLMDIKKSDNSKIYFEMLLIKFMRDNNKINNTNVRFANDDVFNKFNNELIDKSTIKKVDKVKNNNIISKNKKVLNVDDIVKIRINNLSSIANSTYRNEFVSKMDLLNDYLFDKDFGFIVKLLIDSQPVMVSDDNVVLMFKYDSSLNQIKEYFNILDDIFYKIFNKKYIVSIISENDWKNFKNDFSEKYKKGIKLDIIEEPKPIFEEIKNNDIINNDLIEKLSDLIEYE